LLKDNLIVGNSAMSGGVQIGLDCTIAGNEGGDDSAGIVFAVLVIISPWSTRHTGTVETTMKKVCRQDCIFSGWRQGSPHRLCGRL